MNAPDAVQPEEWRESRAPGWYHDIGYTFDTILNAHRYGIEGTLSKPDDPGWHACTCGWEGYWSAFHPHVSDHLRAAAMRAVETGTREQIADEVETYRRSLTDDIPSYHGTIRNADDMSWVLAQARDRIAKGGAR